MLNYRSKMVVGAVALVWLSLAATGSAALVSTKTLQQTPIVPSNTDLLQTTTITVTAINFEKTFEENREKGTVGTQFPLRNGSNANDGNANGGNLDNDSLDLGGVANGSFVEYELDLAANSLGYDITQIGTYYAWNERYSQRYRMEASFVGDPTNFTELAPMTSYYNQNQPRPGWTSVVHTDSGGGVLDNGSISMTGVARLRFEFEGASLGWNKLREIDVMGTPTQGQGGAIPEPMTMLAVGLGISGLGGYIRKRRRA